MSSSGMTLYAALLRNRQMAAQKKQEQQMYEDERYDKTMAQSLASAAQSEQAKNSAFERQLRVAELMGKSAGTTGQERPTGFTNPAVQEWGDTAYGGGESARVLEQRKRTYELQKQTEDALLGINETAYMSISPEAEAARSNIASRRLGQNIPSIVERMTPAQKARASGKDPVEGWRTELSKYPNVKEFYEAVPQVRAIQTAADDAAGDLSIIMGFARITQPGSRGVTDADFVNFASAGGAGERVKQMVSFWLKNRRVDGKMRKLMQEEAMRHFEAKRRAASGDAQWFSRDIVPPEFHEQVIHPLLRGGSGQTEQRSAPPPARPPRAVPQAAPQRDELDDAFDEFSGLK